MTSAPPDPNTAQSIAYNMMASFGFSPQTYFGCLVDLWNRESGWRVRRGERQRRVRHPAGAAGQQDGQRRADWETNPATQIRWGLGYIKGIYGNPCGAWAFEEANGYY